MYITIVLPIILAGGFAASIKEKPVVPMLDGKIVGGTYTTIEQYPYQLSLELNGRHICGASIISEKKALTAAHCTDRQSARSLRVRASSSYRGNGGQIANVAKICQHPSYTSWNIDNDASVLILSSAITLGPGARAIALASSGSDIPAGTLATVTGWGTTSQGGAVSSQLQKVDVPRVSDSACKRTYGSSAITLNMMCFGYTRGGKDSCQGDSGGPLASGGQQIGIVSWGNGCAQPNTPGVYSKVSSLRNHIDRC